MRRFVSAIALCLIADVAFAAMTIRSTPGSAWSDPPLNPPCPKMTQHLQILNSSSLRVTVTLQPAPGVTVVTPGNIEIKTDKDVVLRTCTAAVSCQATWYQKTMDIGENVVHGIATMPNGCWIGIGSYVDRK